MSTAAHRLGVRRVSALSVAGALLLPALAIPAEQAGGTISGRVTSRRDGRPLPTASVTLSSLTGTDQKRATPDAAGNFRFSGVAPGAYTIRATAKAYCSLEWGEDGTSFDGGLPIVMAASRQIDRIDLPLPDGAVITGTVVDANRDPLDAIPVYALRVEYVAGRRVLLPVEGRRKVSDDRGRYRLFGLQPGTYYVVAAPGQVSGGEPADEELPGYSLTYFPGTTDAASAEAIVIKSCGESHPAPIALAARRTFSLSGTALAGDGTPASGAEIILMPGSDASVGLAAHQVASASGAFAFTNIPPGRYVVQMLPSRPAAGFASEVLALQGDVADLVLRARPSRAFRGTIRFDTAQGQGPAAGTVDLRPRSTDYTRSPIARGGRARVAPDWSFVLEDVWGPHQLSVHAPEGWALAGVRAGPDNLTGQAIDFDRIPTSDPLEVVLTDRLPAVSGSVTTKAGGSAYTPVLLFTAADASASPPYVRWTITDIQGHFAFRGVPDGDYQVIALDRIRREMIEDPRVLAALEPLATRTSVTRTSQPLALRPVPARRIDP